MITSFSLVATFTAMKQLNFKSGDAHLFPNAQIFGRT